MTEPIARPQATDVVDRLVEGVSSPGNARGARTTPPPPLDGGVTSRVEPALVYIAGTGRCGSTLLDLLLNGSPVVHGAGEIQRLAHDFRTGVDPCTCGQPVAACPFWLAIQREGAEELKLSSDTKLLESQSMSLVPDDLGSLVTGIQKVLLLLGERHAYGAFSRAFARPHDQAVRNSMFWYDVIRRVTGKPIIVDSSKNARRMKALYLADPERFKLLILIRDGRAVAASEVRRTGVSMEVAAQNWVESQRRVLWAQASIPRVRKKRIFYERLCQNPGVMLRSVCRFAGIPYDDDLLRIRRDTAHNVGGNPMRHRTGETTIELDDRWRLQLKAADLAVFQRIGGRLNERLGYQI